MRKKRIVLAILLLNLLYQSGLSAASNPNWFTLVFQQWDNFWNNSVNLNTGYTGTFISFGQLQSRPNVWETPPFPEWELLTIEVSIPGNEMRLYKVGDSSKWFDYTLMFKEIKEIRDAPDLELIHYHTTVPFEFVVQCGLDVSTTTEFFINIQPRHGGGNGRFGTYTTQIVFDVFDKEHALLAQKTYDFILYNKYRNGNETDDYSVLLIERYQTAGNIDIEYLQQHSSEKLDVGAVTFVSNETCGMYYLNFSPSPDSTCPFCFVNEAVPSCTIPYKVVDPLNSSISHSHQFDLALPYTPDGIGWRDRLELAIRNANYTNITPRVGHYRSVIQIELRNN